MKRILCRTCLAVFVSFGLSCVVFNSARGLEPSSFRVADADPKRRILKEMTQLGALRSGFSEFYISPTGQKSGKGSIDSPLELASVLSGDIATIRPGDVVWLRGGTYVGPFTSRVKGTAALPVNFRQYPGERAVLVKDSNGRDRGTLDVRGDHVWFWDLEVANTSTDRKRLDADGKLNPMRGSGINIYAAGTKYINLIVHDNGHGFGLWNEDGGTEIYGCLIFNNGNNKKEHGVYGHNKTGAHTIRNNIIFNNAGYGLHLYANSTESSLSGFDIERNTIFNNGALTADDQVADQILVGGVKGVSAERINIASNYIFNEPDAPTSKNRGIRLGYEDTGNKDVKLIDNYIVSKVPLRVLWWESVEARGNTIYTNGKAVDLVEPPASGKRNYQWSANTYIGPAAKAPDFLLNDGKFSFASWRHEKGFDRDTMSSAATENAIFVTTNKYDSSRSTVTIFNWRGADKVAVDLSRILRQGDAFEIRDAQDVFAKPVVAGIYDGRAVMLRMNSTEVARPVGETEVLPRHSGTAFGVFLITKKGGDGSPPE